jgi:hypothetical protein
VKLVPIGEDARRFVARIDDLDMPVRRIFNLDRLLDAVRTRIMGLAAPHGWDDPREDLAALCMLDGTGLSPPRQQQQLADFLAPAWAQCWSFNPGSDTLLRAYSRVDRDPKTQNNRDRAFEGVTVTTTVRHLLAAAEAWHADGVDCHVVVGRVEYLPDPEIGQRIVNVCNGSAGPSFFRSVQGRADGLMWKRDYFAHEQEVRLMIIARAWPKDAPVPPFREVRIDPDLLFREISFDPRLNAAEVREREAEFRAAGFDGPFRLDISYQKILHLLEMRQNWDGP